MKTLIDCIAISKLHFKHITLILLFLQCEMIYAQGELDDDHDQVELCGLPSNGWNFENIIASSCTNIGCDSYGTNPEFQDCLCGASPGIVCNYRLSHGTPHLHPYTGLISGYFGAMVGGVRAEISRGEGIYFCATTYRYNTCVNISFDIVTRRNQDYDGGYLYIKLVKPDEMITQAGVPPSSCALTPPNISSFYLQDLATIQVKDYEQYNNTNDFVAENISFSFYPENNVVQTDPVYNLQYYYLWFYYQGGPNGNDQIMGIDNIELSLAYSDPPVCEQSIILYDYDAPIVGDYLAEKSIYIYSINDLFLEPTVTFTAGEQILIEPVSVSTNLTMTDNDFNLFCIVPVECSPCEGYDPPIPFISANTILKFDAENITPDLVNSEYFISNNNINDQSKHEQQKLNSDLYEIYIFNTLGQIVYSGKGNLESNYEVFKNKLLHNSIYLKQIRLNQLTISTELFYIAE